MRDLQTNSQTKGQPHVQRTIRIQRLQLITFIPRRILHPMEPVMEPRMESAMEHRLEPIMEPAVESIVEPRMVTKLQPSMELEHPVQRLQPKHRFRFRFRIRERIQQQLRKRLRLKLRTKLQQLRRFRRLRRLLAVQQLQPILEPIHPGMELVQLPSRILRPITNPIRIQLVEPRIKPIRIQHPIQLQPILRCHPFKHQQPSRLITHSKTKQTPLHTQGFFHEQAALIVPHRQSRSGSAAHPDTNARTPIQDREP